MPSPLAKLGTLFQDRTRGKESAHVLAEHSFLGRNSGLSTNYPVLKPSKTVSPKLPLTTNISEAQRIKFRLVAQAHVSNREPETFHSEVWTAYIC